jgi:hypothetical protein
MNPRGHLLEKLNAETFHANNAVDLRQSSFPHTLTVTPTIIADSALRKSKTKLTKNECKS